ASSRRKATLNVKSVATRGNIQATTVRLFVVALVMSRQTSNHCRSLFSFNRSSTTDFGNQKRGTGLRHRSPNGRAAAFMRNMALVNRPSYVLYRWSNCRPSALVGQNELIA